MRNKINETNSFYKNSFTVYVFFIFIPHMCDFWYDVAINGITMKFSLIFPTFHAQRMFIFFFQKKQEGNIFF